MSKRHKAKYIILILSSFIFHLSSLLNCTSPTKTQTVTFSGTVTLADTTDYSGVQVMLFKPVEIDTALTNLNKNYPGVGIEVNQRTEFFWREHEPAYTTTTDAKGKWQIKNVEPGTYHIVVKKGGYGWRVLYDANYNSDNKITLKKAIVWQGTYSEPVTIPANSFVEVIGNTVFEKGLTIEAGTIVEFKNKENNQPQSKIVITVNGDFSVNGINDSRVFVVSDDSSNFNTIEVKSSPTASIAYCIARQIYNPFYFKDVPIVTIAYNRFAHNSIGMIIQESDSAVVNNNMVTQIAIDGLQTFDTHLNLQKNFFYDCGKMGLNSKNANNSLVKYNVFKRFNATAIAMNLGGYNYKDSYIYVKNNDFKESKNHISIGKEGEIIVNENNFLKVKNYFVWTDGANELVTLNFKYNYWGETDIQKIYKKIYDKNDRIGQKFEGPIVVIKEIKISYIFWENEL